jgi:putative lipoprotein
VKVEGHLKRKLDLVKGSRETLLVVTRLLESDKRQCQALPEVALEGTQWMLRELGGRTVPQGRRRDPYLMLQPARGKVFGFGGCNHFKAGYRLNGQKIHFEQPGSTRMHCKTGYELETSYLRMFQKTDGWRVRGKLLDLFDAKGKRIARFMASAPR